MHFGSSPVMTIGNLAFIAIRGIEGSSGKEAFY
jgi:hypothetical protein